MTKERVTAEVPTLSAPPRQHLRRQGMETTTPRKRIPPSVATPGAPTPKAAPSNPPGTAAKSFFIPATGNATSDTAALPTAASKCCGVIDVSEEETTKKTFEELFEGPKPVEAGAPITSLNVVECEEAAGRALSHFPCTLSDSDTFACMVDDSETHRERTGNSSLAKLPDDPQKVQMPTGAAATASAVQACLTANKEFKMCVELRIAVIRHANKHFDGALASMESITGDHPKMWEGKPLTPRVALDHITDRADIDKETTKACVELTKSLDAPHNPSVRPNVHFCDCLRAQRRLR